MLIKALVLALASWASAQNALPSQIPVQYRDFSGGYVDNVDPVNLKPNESPSLLNVVVDDPVGSLKPRRGFVRCGNLPSGNTATNLHEYTKSDGTRRLIATDNQNIYATPDCKTWVTINTGMSASAQVHFATIRDKLWIVNGSTWPHTWDGSTLTILDGRANTPNPTIPKCSTIEFWKERVWCGAPIGNPSGLYFSALTGVDGNDLDPSTGTLAWPAINVFQIDENAGSRLYGVKAYRNRLYAMKDNGVWEVGFENEFNNFVRKTFASVGTRYQTSIAEVDGVLYFTGRDGIYAFDGDNSVRVSRTIENKFRTINQPLISQNYKLWSTSSEFDTGTYSSATATDLSGAVTLSSAPAIVDNGRFETGTFSPFSGHTAGALASYASVAVTNVSPIEGVYSASATASCALPLSSVQALTRLYLFDSAGSTLTYVNMTQSGQTVSTYTLDTSAWVGRSVRLHWLAMTYAASSNAEAHIYSEEFTARSYVTFQHKGESSCGNFVGWTGIDNVQNFEYLAQGTWTGPVYDTVSVSTWGAMTATSQDNGGSVAYEVRYGTNTGAVAAMAYIPITPGSLIPANTGMHYIQFRATLYAPSDLRDTPEIEDIQVAWNSGGNNTQKVYAYGWRNALWVSASSGTATTNNIVFNRASPPINSWTLHDLKIGPMATFNDYFYAAASTHSAIYRMDYGTNDDGAAIGWHWESKDENFGLPNNAKYLPEMNADYRNNASCNIRMGYVQEQNTTYCVGNLPGTTTLGEGVGSRRLNMNGGPAYTYRFKVCDDTRDQSPTIIGLGGWARPINRRGD